MNTRTLARDLTIAIFFFAGLLCFVSGQFILSTTLFGVASLASNIQPAKTVRI